MPAEKITLTLTRDEADQILRAIEILVSKFPLPPPPGAREPARSEAQAGRLLALVGRAA